MSKIFSKRYMEVPQMRVLKIFEREWFWFRDTFTGRDLVVVRRVGSYGMARRVYKSLVGGGFEGVGKFGGLQVPIYADKRCKEYIGSVIYLASDSRAIMAHEVFHAVMATLRWHGIDNEEAVACCVTTWMDIIQEKFGLLDS
jgi:hypothetical protein